MTFDHQYFVIQSLSYALEKHKYGYMSLWTKNIYMLHTLDSFRLLFSWKSCSGPLVDQFLFWYFGPLRFTRGMGGGGVSCKNTLMFMSVIHKQDKITTIQHINIKTPKQKCPNLRKYSSWRGLRTKMLHNTTTKSNCIKWSKFFLKVHLQD